MIARALQALAIEYYAQNSPTLIFNQQEYQGPRAVSLLCNVLQKQILLETGADFVHFTGRISWFRPLRVRHRRFQQIFFVWFGAPPLQAFASHKFSRDFVNSTLSRIIPFLLRDTLIIVDTNDNEIIRHFIFSYNTQIYARERNINITIREL